MSAIWWYPLRVESLLKVRRLNRIPLFVLALGVLGARQGTPPPVYPPANYPLQSGAVQMPLRLCVLRSLAGAKTEPAAPNQTGTLVQGHAPDNFFYSTSPTGGAFNLGTMFSITRKGDVKVLYSFIGKADGAGPRGGVALGNDGYLYGTTPSGGDYGVGMIFKIPRSGGRPTPVFSFRNGRVVPPPAAGVKPTQQQLMDAAGSYPSTAPVPGTDGNLYGVTGYANNVGTGTLYRISPSGQPQVSVSF